MPLLASWIGSLFVGFASFLGTWLTKRVAITLAAVAAIVTVTGSFLAALYGLLAGLSMAIPADIVLAASWMVPSNAIGCLTAVLSAKLLRWVYDWNTRVIQMKLL